MITTRDQYVRGRNVDITVHSPRHSCRIWRFSNPGFFPNVFRRRRKVGFRFSFAPQTPARCALLIGFRGEVNYLRAWQSAHRRLLRA